MKFSINCNDDVDYSISLGLNVVAFTRTQPLLNLLASDFGLSHFESTGARTKFLHLVAAQFS